MADTLLRKPHITPDDNGDEPVVYFDNEDDDDDYFEYPESSVDAAGNATHLSAMYNSSGLNLWDMNSLRASLFVPLLCVLAFLLLMAVLGNALVCLIYRTRFRRNTANLLVVFIASLDMICACVGIPMEMAVLALPLVYHSEIACKVTRFVEAASVCMSLLALAGVAADRYCKLCRPADCLPLRRAQWLCCGAVILSLVLASPACIVFGIHTVHTGVPGLEGSTCAIEDSMLESPMRIVYISLLLFTFAFSALIVFVLYLLIMARMVRRRSTSRGERVSPARREFPRKHRFVTDDSTSSCGGGYEETRKLPTGNSSTSVGGTSTNGCGGAAATASGTSNSTARHGRTSPGFDPARVPLKGGVKESARIGQGASSMVDVQSTRMTWIFFMVSVICCVTIVPFLVMRTLRATASLREGFHSVAAVMWFQISSRSYFLHGPAKPLVYLAFNPNFRRECRLLIISLWSSCVRRPNSSVQ